MNRRDEGKVSLVDFLRSIKFTPQNLPARRNVDACKTHFAPFDQHVRQSNAPSTEDSQLIRSAN